MEHPDLHFLPEGHAPSPYKSPVLIVKVGDGFLPKGLRLCTVGWLEKPGFPTGKVPDRCINALVVAHRDRIFSDGYRGIHACTLCGKELPHIRWRKRTIRLKGHGHYLVRLKKTVFMAPELLLHYIRSHEYLPPQEFIDATVEGQFMTEDDLDIRWRSSED